MRRLLLITAVVFISCNFYSEPASGMSTSALVELSDSLSNLSPDFDHQAKIEDTLLITRGAASFALTDGILTLSKPVYGHPLAVAFSGKVHFHMTLPNKAERYMFNKRCQDTVADWNFERVTFIFTDSTYEQLVHALNFEPLQKRHDAGRQIEEFVNYIEDEFEESFPALMLNDLLQPWHEESFYARFVCDCGRMVYSVRPADIEEVKLYKHTQTESEAYPELISSFHLPDEYATSKWGPDHEDKDVIDSLYYSIFCKIRLPSRTDLQVDLRFQSQVDDLQTIKFDLFSELKQNSIVVENADGDSLYWQKLKDESGITVFLDKPLKRGEWCSLRFGYSSTKLVKLTPWGSYDIRSPVYWFPRYGYLKRARYKLKYEYPKQFTFLSVGRKTSDTTVGDFTTASFDLSKYFVSLASFNYGIFESKSDSLPGGIPVVVYASEDHKGSIGKMIDKVLFDVKHSAEMFSEQVYPYPFNKLIATEIPASHGQGFPGLLHLAWSTFQYEEIGEYDAFRAHEVAHQWWGNVVGWQTYHDQWLSEAFAEYFGAWYVQQKYLHDDKHRGLFYDLMDRWREDVYESGSYTKGGFQTQYQEGNDAGPIWMGQRLASSRSADYFTLVYSKGAYVLYMLRMMMFDFAHRDDSNFRRMLAAFIDRFQWKEASTSDFAQIAEEYYGQDLDWFFDQWVYDTVLPEYLWKATVRQQNDGKYEVKVKVDVKGVDEDFRMPVPFTILMEGNYNTTTRLDIRGKSEEITIPNIPYKPKRFIFNTFKSVLCKSQEK